ncbi:MAG: hypothetical protein HYR75_07910 [Gemmatimonadetes bacterium]|nr:hypothetical protein [Gemmatimonadota bacterium]MBI3567589.1 hypothetical protein [Gemmatimonadota bacterium]
MDGVQAFAAVAVVIVASYTVLTVVRAVVGRIERRGSPRAELPAEAQARMERMERALESVSIEIERISESQRFLTKVLTERERQAIGDGRAGASSSSPGSLT